MSTIYFTKVGLFRLEAIKEGERWVEKRERVSLSKVWSCLREVCEIDEGVTLLDIFRTVDHYLHLKAFLSQYSWCDSLEEHHKQAEEPCDVDENPDEKLEYLEISWRSSFSTYKGETYIDYYLNLDGVGYPNDENVHSDDRRNRYGVDFTPVNELAHLPVRLNTTMEIHDDYTKEPFKVTTLVKAKKVFTLLEVLDAIYDEISFHGGPQRKYEMLQDIRQRVEDIKSGKAKTVPLETLFEEDQDGATLPEPE